MMPFMGFSTSSGALLGGGLTEEETKLLETSSSSSPPPSSLMINMATNGVINHSIILDQHHQQHNHHHYHDDLHQIQGHHHQIPYAMMQSPTSSSIPVPPGNFISKDAGGAYELGELDQALFLYLDGQDTAPLQDQRESTSAAEMRPPTLNMFPSQPMHSVDPSSSTKPSNQTANIKTPGFVSSSSPTSGSKRQSEPFMELANGRNNATPPGPEPAKPTKREGNRKGPTTSSNSEHEGPKTPDPKTLRRLAQNREAARKSRLRKKAYVQQLESSRIKLAQLEHELQRARSQGMFLGTGGNLLGSGDQGLGVGIGNISSDAAIFDMEYARWLEEHHRLTCELRAAVQEHQLPESELRLFVDNFLAHYDEVVSLKGMVAKTDVFHLVSGVWKSPAERCFMWMGGFRPSDLIKIIVRQIEALSEQQIVGICGLQQSIQEAEEALTQGMEALNQSVSDTIASDSLTNPPHMPHYMSHMSLAINKLSTLEAFVTQADNLRHQTIHRLYQILTIRQAARCLLAIAEYFHRLRTLSSLWLARPRQE